MLENRMEFVSSKVNNAKYEPHFPIIMDHDSGYISHHQESNSDSSLENLGDSIINPPSCKAIYLSEDALLEKPIVNCRFGNVSSTTGNCDETKDLFTSPEKIPTSVASVSTSYSGFDNDSQSDTSIEIPISNQIITKNDSPVCVPSTLNIVNKEAHEMNCSVKLNCNINVFNSDNEKDCLNEYKDINNHFIMDNNKDILANNQKILTDDNFLGKFDSFKRDDSGLEINNFSIEPEVYNMLALNNITNSHQYDSSSKYTENKKKLTLIFTKDNKENMYSVKRKYRSITPDKNTNAETNDSILESNDMPQTNDTATSFISKEKITLEETNIIKRENLSSNTPTSLIPQDEVHFDEIKIVNNENFVSNDVVLEKSEIIEFLGFPQSSNLLVSAEKVTFPKIEISNSVIGNLNLNNVALEENSTYTRIFNVHESSSSFLTSEEKVSVGEIENLKNVYKSDNVLEKSCTNNENISHNRQIVSLNSNNNDFNEDISPEENISKKNVLNNGQKPLDSENDHKLKNKQNKNISNSIEKSATPIKKFENFVDPNISPDIFGEEEHINEETKELIKPVNYICDEKYIVNKDRRILRRVQNGLKGVLPPVSMTIVQLSVTEMLDRLKNNEEYFCTKQVVEKNNDNENRGNLLNSTSESNCKELKSLLLTGEFQTCTQKVWPNILEERYHGLHYNRSKLSEEFEELCTKYAQRYVGAETQSSCTSFETSLSSPMKRKQMKQRWAVKSPGRRLSHLARRRITFSSSNLQAGSSSAAGSRARQILVDARKLDLLKRRSPRKSPRKTPKKTPSKSPPRKTRTPSSSAKKKLALRFRKLSGEIEKTVPSTSTGNFMLSSKRALFQSPERDPKSNLLIPSMAGSSTFEKDLKKPSTKRALFMSPSKKSSLRSSPFKRSPFKRLELGVDKKRKRSESNDSHPSKIARNMSIDRPSESEVKSIFTRNKSEINISMNRSQTGELSAIHKKKLQWAVYEALRSQDITPGHAQFKVFASVLARVTRKFLPNLNSNAPRPEGGTSDRMLRIARHHVYAVVKGKSVDEIVSDYLKTRPKNLKRQGYIGIEEYNNEKKDIVKNDKENLIQRMGDKTGSLKKNESWLSKPKVGNENRIERIRKVINFGDDNR